MGLASEFRVAFECYENEVHNIAGGSGFKMFNYNFSMITHVWV